MAGLPPPGEPVPPDGVLPSQALAGSTQRPLGIYLHVPFCRTRCGYCDFNTYTAAELGADPGRARDAYLAATRAEIALARRVLGPRRVSTVFVGGGTPTLVASRELVALLDVVRQHFHLEADAEVTTEANPESVSWESLNDLRAGGFTRISYGMQSASPQVLATLDRAHTSGRAVAAVAQARSAGFEDISLDLIYGTPGESLADWRHSVEVALSAEPDHVSGYALIVEDGTGLARRIRRGELPAPDDDDLADKYLLADELLSAAGLAWYELSNWARPGHPCRHNLAYWRSQDWWGIGPGAHSHINGVRWWNVRHPTRYAARLAAGQSPGQAREVLDAATRRVERVLLELRLASGLDADLLTQTERARAAELASRGLLEAGRLLRLTRSGRLLADAVVRDLLD